MTSTTSNKETRIHDFLEIPKQSLQNLLQISNKNVLRE